MRKEHLVDRLLGAILQQMDFWLSELAKAWEAEVVDRTEIRVHQTNIVSLVEILRDAELGAQREMVVKRLKAMKSDRLWFSAVDVHLDQLINDLSYSK